MIQVLHSEFYEALYWAAMCFVSGVSLREFAKDRTGKWLGRFSVLVGFCLLAAFGQFSIKQCQVIYAVASPSVSPVAVVALDKEFTVKIAEGIEISWSQYNDGGSGPVSIGNRRGGIDVNANSGVDNPFTATGIRTGSMPSTTSGRPY